MKNSKMRLFNSADDIYLALSEGIPITQKFSYSHPVKTGGKSINLSLGRIWWNILLPSDIPLINEPVDKSKIVEIFNNMSDIYPPEDLSDMITTINLEVFKMGTYVPSTFNIDNLILSDEVKLEKEKLKNKEYNDPIEFNNDVKKITDKLVKELEIKDDRINNINVSKAKDVPFSKLMVASGYISDIENQLHGPIKESINDGTDPKGFYLNASEARKGFYYKAAISAKPGYLARRVVMANAQIQLDDSISDCGSTKYFNLTIDKTIAKLIKDRYYVKSTKPTLIRNPDELIGQTIKMRSPLYCKSTKGICPICYGNSWKTLDNKNIGILAGGNINFVALNAYMKARHKSSVPEYKKINFLEELKKYGLLTPKLQKQFLIEENKITANKECFIIIDTGQYNDTNFIESQKYYSIPGIIDCTLLEDEETINFPFSFNVELFKSSEIETERKKITIRYQPGETIMHQECVEKTPDVSLMEQLIEGRTKYLKKPEMLVIGLSEFLGGMDLCGLELIVQNMFRDNSDQSIPARLTDYSDFSIIGQKQLPFVTSWINALSFENVKKAINYGLLTGQNAKDNPITKIMNEKYDDE